MSESILDPHLRFDTFVVGAANRLAASAARAVVDAPGTAYNPLFVFGGAGLGKTHLLTAIAHAMAERHPDMPTRYITLDDFADELDAAIRGSQADAFKRRYQDIGVLLLDDVQGLSGRREMQSEILRVFNVLQGAGRQIVMGSDRAPADIRDVDQRLLNRLSGGLTVDIGPPDQEARTELLRRFASTRRITFGGGVLEQLARSPLGNVRELQGALNQLVAHQAVAGALLAPNEVWQVLGTAQLPQRADEFESFLQDVVTSVAASVEAWRTHLTARIAWWSGQGFRTAVLERALELPEAPDVEELDSSFAAVADRLRTLEGVAIRVDRSLTGHAAFRDPERLREAETLLAHAVAAAEPLPPPDNRWQLTDLVRTAGNRAAIQAVADLVEQHGEVGTPLFVHGKSGAGKTHVAHAAARVLLGDEDSGKRVAIVSGAAWLDELLVAMHAGQLERWRARYRLADALVVDGFQAFDRQTRAHDELLALGQIYSDAGRPVLLTSDRPLGAYVGISAGLRAWIEGGRVVHLVAPSVNERTGRQTPVPDGDEAAAPNIDIRGVRDATPPDGVRVTRLTPPGGIALGVAGLDAEKMILEWPEAPGRLMEEMR